MGGANDTEDDATQRCISLTVALYTLVIGAPLGDISESILKQSYRNAGVFDAHICETLSRHAVITHLPRRGEQMSYISMFTFSFDSSRAIFSGRYDTENLTN